MRHSHTHNYGHKFPMLVLLVVGLIVITREGIDARTAPYPNCKVLSSAPRYELCWRMEKEDISVQIQVGVTGRWFGFGLGEPTSGSMPGADIVTIEADGDKLKAVDRYALMFARPEEDSCQDWKMEGFEVSSASGQPSTTVHLRRRLLSSDIQDRNITSGDVRIIWAIGKTPNLMYHGSTRGVGAINFANPTPPPETPGQTWEFRLNNVEIPHNKATNYMCASMTLPQVEDAHVIRVESMIDPTAESAPMVHHFLVYICEKGVNGSWERFETPQNCHNGPGLGSPESGCTTPFFAWAVGTGPLIMPPEAGIRMGTAKDYALRYAVIQVHFDNPSLKVGIRDNSGIKVTYTTALRPNDAGVMNFGDPFTSLASIPPGLEPDDPAAWYQVDCPSECTRTWPYDINVFADILHMHQAGSRIWATEWTANSSLVGTFNSAHFYQFKMQQITYHTPAKILSRGNRLNLNCVYDTSGRTETTKFAGGSDDEMCMQFLFYYPLLMAPKHPTRPFSVCGYIYIPQAGMTQNATVCGDIDLYDLIQIPNPSVVDPRSLGDSSFGKDPGHCSSEEPSDDGDNDGGASDSDDEKQYWQGYAMGMLTATIVVVCCLATVSVVVVLLMRQRKNRYAVVGATSDTTL